MLHGYFVHDLCYDGLVTFPLVTNAKVIIVNEN